MAKLKYDVSGIEEQEDKGFDEYDGEPAKPGTYNGRVDKATVTKSSNDNPMVEWIVVIEDDPYDGHPLWFYTTYTGDEEKDWKFANTIRAIGMKDKGAFDDEKVTEAKPKIRIRVKNETYEGEKRPKCAKILPAKAGSSSKAKKDDDDGDGDDPPF